jgi:hypothetical protein
MKDLIQARRDLITQLLAAHGYKATVDSLTGHAFKNGQVVSMANDPTALDLLPHLSSIQEELNFQRRMKFISIDGGPPIRRDTPAHANDQGSPPPELLKMLDAIINQGAARPPEPRKRRPHTTNRKPQGELF